MHQQATKAGLLLCVGLVRHREQDEVCEKVIAACSVIHSMSYLTNMPISRVI